MESNDGGGFFFLLVNKWNVLTDEGKFNLNISRATLEVYFLFLHRDAAHPSTIQSDAVIVKKKRSLKWESFAAISKIVLPYKRPIYNVIFYYTAAERLS